MEKFYLKEKLIMETETKKKKGKPKIKNGKKVTF